MESCIFCNLSNEDKKWLLYENEDWTVYLADHQDYAGRCIVVCKQHCSSISELNICQWTSLKVIINSLESMLKYELGATMYNWSCLMNDAYKSDKPNPHIHFHVRPRYKEPVLLDHSEYIDHEFAHHYINNHTIQITEETANYIYSQLKKK